MSIRRLILGVVLIVLVAGLVVAGKWAYDTYFPQPEALLASAQKHFNHGQDALARKDLGEAQRNYEFARIQLDKLIDLKEVPGPLRGDAFLLRHKTFKALAEIAVEQKDEARALDLTNAAWTAAHEAVAADPSKVEALVLIQDYLFSRDEIDAAEPYSELLVQFGSETMSDDPSYPSKLMAAHYVLARRALRAKTPNPDVALTHLHAIERILADAAESGPRWREIDLEAQALKVKADESRKAAASRPGAAKGPNEAQRQLDERVPQWVERARAELDKPLEPTADTKEGRPHLQTLRPTNRRGLLQFLVLAVELAPDRGKVDDRARLTLSVCEKVTAGDRPKPLIQREVAAAVGQLALTLARLQAPRQLTPKEWAEVSNHIQLLADAAQKSGTPVDPAAYLALALGEAQHGPGDQAARLAAAERLTRAGLEAAEKRQLGPDKEIVQDLNSELAWLLLLQKKNAEAEKPLGLLRKQRTAASRVHVMEGLVAVRDGRLEQGLQHLRLAQQNPKYARTAYVLAGLADAYLGLGDYANAVAPLQALEALLQKQDQLTDEERLVTRELLPTDPDRVQRELLRCYLALGRLDDALRVKEQIENRPEGLAARIILINYYLDVGRLKQAADNYLDARDAFYAARKELTAARKLHPDDPSLVWAEARLVLGEGRDAKKNEAKAEELLKAFAAKKTFEGALLWVHWLMSHQRLDEAHAALVQLETKDFPDRKKELTYLHGQLQLERGQGQDVARLMQTLRADGQELDSDILHVLYLVNVERDPAKADKVLEASLSKNESNILLHYWRAQLAEQGGYWVKAVQEYGKALPFSRYRAASQLGLLRSMRALAQQNPKGAYDLAGELQRANPSEPALLLAYSDAARQMDNLKEMEAALKGLEDVLRRQGAEKGAGADFLARGWVLAGRPDLAWPEIERALRENPDSTPALGLAVLLARDNGDWEHVRERAEILRRLLGGQAGRGGPAPVHGLRSMLDRSEPSLADALYWNGEALDHLGRVEEARLVYQQLVDQFPDLPGGYFGQADSRERTKDYTGALEWVRRWRRRSPDELRGIRAELRLLVLAGKPDEANAVAEEFVAKEQVRHKAEAEAQNAKLPPGDAAMRQRFDHDARDALVEADRLAACIIAASFVNAKAFAPAEAWTRRAVELAEKLSPTDGTGQPSAVRRRALVEVYLLTGELYILRSKTRQGSDRAADVEQGIAAYDKVWKLSPGNFVAGNNLAYLLLKERNQPEAAYLLVQELRRGQHSRKVLSGDRLDLAFLDTLAEVYLGSKHSAEAVDVLKQALQRHKKEPRVYLLLGRANKDLKRNREAYENLSLAIAYAEERAELAKAPEHKATWKALAEEARGEQKELR